MNEDIIYSDEHLYIEAHKSSVPWLKVFTKESYKEFSEVPFKIKLQLLAKLDIIEREMLYFYNPTKINIASFGNENPHIHFHIMARFEEDECFPNPMWGEKLRESKDFRGDFDKFIQNLRPKLEPIILEEED